MKIIEPSVGLWKQGDDVKAHVAKCARVCYGKETGNDDVTINTLLKKHHWSMFRHESVYVIGEFTSRLSIALTRYDNNPYIDWTFHNNKLYIVTNGNFILDLKEQQEVNAHAQVLLTYINYYRVSEDTFFNNEIGYNMMRYTFCIITQISTSRELNRVSPNNIAEQSTRYCNYSRGRFEGECAICQPHWFDFMQEEVAYYKFEDGKCHYIKVDDGEWHPYDNTAVVLRKYKQPMLQRYLLDNDSSCRAYLAQIADGMEPQDARGELPLDLATEVVYTYSVNEWRHILDLRYYGKTGKPHPNAKIIAGMIKDELDELGYDFE